MPKTETIVERYRRLAAECLDAANNQSRDDQRNALLQMAQVWQRLAGRYDEATPAFSEPAAPQPAIQQQQQVQPDDEKKE
jgi:hypothetical protein